MVLYKILHLVLFPVQNVFHFLVVQKVVLI